ncbi:MAG: ATP-dependent DNA helicase, partial [Nocardioides sp.]
MLAVAVEALGGQERPGQVEMAEAVASAMTDHRHLLVQAGTGTGKSLAYLVPALLHDQRVVVATATLALQHQLVERDIPAVTRAVADLLPGGLSYAVLKGRSNYACLHRIREGVPDDQGALIEAPEGSQGKKVLELRAWAEQEAEGGGSGERDGAPRHTDREWRQVSVTHRECLGAARCPFGEECFAELARDKAHRSHLVVTNHSLLAIDAIEGVPMIPEYDVVVVDEAHEVVGRVTQAATDELAASDVDRAARRSQRWVSEGDRESSPADDLADAGDALAAAIAEASPGRFDVVPESLAEALVLVRDAARACLSAYPKETDAGDADAGRTQARGSVQEVFVTAERMAVVAESDVLWLTEGGDPSTSSGQRRFPPRLCVAPLEVWGPMRERLLTDKTVVLTSATLMLGGDFDAMATSVGLRPAERVVATSSTHEESSVEPVGSTAPHALPWVGLDVGSPFDYARQAILYVARHLPPPGRDGLGPAQLDEIVSLVDAAGGRSLGLFSSRRAAETAAEYVRERLPHLTTLAQGEAQLPELARLFVGDPHTCLFGTLSLWQGLDVPGDTCQLVLIDRIPFPRPDDPLMSARQRAADREGRNGFMQVAATHAALLLAQGAGRLIRTST